LKFDGSLRSGISYLQSDKGLEEVTGYAGKLFDESEVAKQRHKILQFYKQYGETATKEAFGADRKVIHVWRKQLRRNDGRIEALIPKSTKPRRLRRMQSDQRIIEFVREHRRKYGRLGKEKLKVLLFRASSQFRSRQLARLLRGISSFSKVNRDVYTTIPA
jgi:transposase-like protein